MPAREAAQHRSVQLLGKRGIPVVRTKTCLDVPQRDFIVEGTKPPDECRCRISLHQDSVDLRSAEKFPQFSGENGTEIPQTLPRTHDLQVEICGDPEVREYLAHHLPMLRGRDNERLQLLGGLELLDNRR